MLAVWVGTIFCYSDGRKDLVISRRVRIAGARIEVEKFRTGKLRGCWRFFLRRAERRRLRAVELALDGYDGLYIGILCGEDVVPEDSGRTGYIV